MTSRQFPLKYVLPGISTLLALCLWASGEYLSQQSWWSKVPWLEIIISLLIFIAGSVYADLFNPDSKLRKLIRELKRVFYIESVHVDTNNETAIKQVVANIRFTRTANNIDFFVRVHAFQNDMARKETFILNETTFEKKEKDQTYESILATVPPREPRNRPVWGRHQTPAGRGKTVHDFHQEAENVVEIGARTWRGTQTQKVLLAGTNKRELGLFISKDEDGVFEISIE